MHGVHSDTVAALVTGSEMQTLQPAALQSAVETAVAVASGQRLFRSVFGADQTSVSGGAEVAKAGKISTSCLLK